MILAGFGNGLEDGGWNAWVGNMKSANELLGLLHGAYGIGGTISPLIATAMIVRRLECREFPAMDVAEVCSADIVLFGLFSGTEDQS